MFTWIAEKIEFSLRTFFVLFGTFFAHDSPLPTRTTTTTKLLLGPLSIARGQKQCLLSRINGMYGACHKKNSGNITGITGSLI